MAGLFADLHLPIPTTLTGSPPPSLPSTLALLSELGYTTVALTQSLPCPFSVPPPSSTPHSIPPSQPPKASKKKPPVNPTPQQLPQPITLPLAYTHVNANAQGHGLGHGHGQGHVTPIILNRLHLHLTPDALRHPPGHSLTSANAPYLSRWDILSLTPTCQATLSLACLTLSQPSPTCRPIDIISLDLRSSPRLPYVLKRSLLHTAVRNGASFEIIYSPFLLPSSGDVRAFISNVRDLVRCLDGSNARSILLTSGADGPASLRAPPDVAAIMGIVGLAPELVRSGMTDLPRQIIRRAQSRLLHKTAVGPGRLEILPAQTKTQTVPAKRPTDGKGLIPTQVPDQTLPPSTDPSKRQKVSATAKEDRQQNQ